MKRFTVKTVPSVTVNVGPRLDPGFGSYAESLAGLQTLRPGQLESVHEGYRSVSRTVESVAPSVTRRDDCFFFLTRLQSSSGTANVASGLPFVPVCDVQFGSFQTNDS